MNVLSLTALPLAALALGLVVGFVARAVVGRRVGRRTLAIEAERLMTEQRIEAISRATLRAMREAAARHFVGR